MDIKQSKEDFADLKKAYNLLESPSLTAQLSNLIGSPIEFAVAKLPAKVRKKIDAVVETAMFAAVKGALLTMKNEPYAEAWPITHKLGVGASGALGGFWGMTSFAVEVPVTTTLMMRSIADIARSEGFDLSELETKKECIAVFALGGPSGDDDGSETGYYASRAFITKAAQALGAEMTTRVAGKAAQSAVNGSSDAAANKLGKWLADILEAVLEKFGVQISEKFVAQAVPVVGAAAGAGINMLFLNHYQDMARGHFTMLRLEKKHGKGVMEEAYASLKSSGASAGGNAVIDIDRARRKAA